jgi:hypothetical protein
MAVNARATSAVYSGTIPIRNIVWPPTSKLDLRTNVSLPKNTMYCGQPLSAESFPSCSRYRIYLLGGLDDFVDLVIPELQ